MNISAFDILSFLLSAIPGVIFSGVAAIEDPGNDAEQITIPFHHDHEPIIFDDIIGTIEERGQLIVDLLQHYDQRNYPVNATVQLGLSLITLDADGYRRNVFHADVLLRYLWTDPRLKWDPSKYGGHNSLSLPAFQVWKPDIRILNSAIYPSFQSCLEANVLLSFTGDIMWVTPCQFIAYCNQTASSPDFYGLKKCGLTFGSWSWDGCPLDLQLYKNKEKADLTFFHDVTPWNVTETKGFRTEKHEKEVLEKFPVQITYDFSVKRKPFVPFHPHFFPSPFNPHF